MLFGQHLPPHAIGGNEFAILNLRIARCTIFERDYIPSFKSSDKLMIRAHFWGHEAEEIVDILPGHTVIGSQLQSGDARNNTDDAVHYRLVGVPAVARTYFCEMKHLNLTLHHFSGTDELDRIGAATLFFVEEDITCSSVVSRRMVLPVMSESNKETSDDIIGKIAVEIVFESSKEDIDQQRGTSEPNDKNDPAFDKISEDLSFMKIEALTNADTVAGKLPQWPSIGNLETKHHSPPPKINRSDNENEGTAFQWTRRKKCQIDFDTGAASVGPNLLEKILGCANSLDTEIEKTLLSKNLRNVASNQERCFSTDSDEIDVASGMDNLVADDDDSENRINSEGEDNIVDEEEQTLMDDSESSSISSIDSVLPHVSFPSLVIADKERYKRLADIDLLNFSVEKVIFDGAASRGLYALRYNVPPLAVVTESGRDSLQIVEVPLPRHSGHSKASVENRKNKRIARITSRSGGNMFREYVLSHTKEMDVSFRNDSDVQCWLDSIIRIHMVLYPRKIDKGSASKNKSNTARKRSMKTSKVDDIYDISGTPIASSAIPLKDVLISPKLSLTLMLPLYTIVEDNQNTASNSQEGMGSISIGISLTQKRRTSDREIWQKSSHRMSAASNIPFEKVDAHHGQICANKHDEEGSSAERSHVLACSRMRPNLADLQSKSVQSEIAQRRRSLQLHVDLKSLSSFQHEFLGANSSLVIRASYSPGASSGGITHEVRIEKNESAAFLWQPLVKLYLPDVTLPDESKRQNASLVLEFHSGPVKSQEKHIGELVGMYRASLSSVTAVTDAVNSIHYSSPYIVVNGWCELINPLSGKFVGKALLMVAIGLRHQIKAIKSLEEAAKYIQFHWKRRHRQSVYCSKNYGSPLKHVQEKEVSSAVSPVNHERPSPLANCSIRSTSFDKESLFVKFHLELRPSGTCINCAASPSVKVPDGCYIKFKIQPFTTTKNSTQEHVWWDATSSFLNGCVRCELHLQPHKSVVDASNVFSIGCDHNEGYSPGTIEVSVCGIIDGAPASTIATSMISHEQMCELSQNSFPSKRILLKLPLNIAHDISWLPNMLEISARLAIEPRSLAVARSFNINGTNFDFKLSALLEEQKVQTCFLAAKVDGSSMSSSAKVGPPSQYNQRDFVHDGRTTLLKKNDTKVVIQVYVGEVHMLGHLISQWSQIRSRDPFEFPPQSGLFISCNINVRDRPLSDSAFVSKVVILKEATRSERVVSFDLSAKFQIEASDIETSTLDVMLWFMPLATPFYSGEGSMFVKRLSLKSKAVHICSIVPIQVGPIFRCNKEQIIENEHLWDLHNQCKKGNAGAIKIKIQFRDDENDSSTRLDAESHDVSQEEKHRINLESQMLLPFSRAERFGGTKSNSILLGLAGRIQKDHNIKNHRQHHTHTPEPSKSNQKTPCTNLQATHSTISKTTNTENEKGFFGIIETLDSVKAILSNRLYDETKLPHDSNAAASKLKSDGVGECDSPSNGTLSTTTSSNYFLSLPSARAESATRRQSLSFEGEGVPCKLTQSITSLPSTIPGKTLIQSKKVKSPGHSFPCASQESSSREMLDEEATSGRSNMFSLPPKEVVMLEFKSAVKDRTNRGSPECNVKLEEQSSTHGDKKKSQCDLCEANAESRQISTPIFTDEAEPKQLELDGMGSIEEGRGMRNDCLRGIDENDNEDEVKDNLSCTCSIISSLSGGESSVEESNEHELSQNNPVSEDIISYCNSNSGTLSADEKQDSNEWLHSDHTSMSFDNDNVGMRSVAQTETDRIARIMGCYRSCASEEDSGEI